MTTFTVGAGQTSTGLSLKAGDVERVLAGGTSSETVIHSGGVESVSHSGADFFTGINSGGRQNLSGVASNSLIEGGVQAIFSGGAAEQAFVEAAGAQDINNGGFAASTTVRSATQEIGKGGAAISTEVSAGGRQLVEAGGRVELTVLHSAGYELVAKGGTDITAALLDDDTREDVYGFASDTRMGGGVQTVFDGGRTLQVLVGSGAQVVSHGGVASQTNVNGPGGTQLVLPGGEAVSTLVNFGGEGSVLGGGKLVSATISGAGSKELVFGSARGATVLDGGDLVVLNGGTADRATIRGGKLEVTSATATDYVVGVAGHADLFGSGSGAFGTIDPGGSQTVHAGGVSSQTTVDGGRETVLTGGVALDDIVESGGVITNSGGDTELTTVRNGGTLVVAHNLDYEDFFTTISFGGVEHVFGSALSTQVDNGGKLVVDNGTADSYKVDAGGIVMVDSKGTLQYGTILAHSVESVGNPGAVGGVSSNTKVEAGGRQIVYTTANFAVIERDGTQVLSGGQAFSTTVSGGLIQIFRGGLADMPTINVSAGAGGEEIFSGGKAEFAVLTSGAGVLVSSGGTDIDPNIGGNEVVFAGGNILSPTLDGGGALVLETGANISGPIIFTDSGNTLKLENAPAVGQPLPANVIFGFSLGDIIDLPHFKPTDSLVLGPGNVATITQGAVVDQLFFDPSQSPGNLLLTADLSGGAEIRVIPDPGGSFFPPPGAMIAAGPDSTIVAAANDTVTGGDNDVFDLSRLSAATGGALIEDAGASMNDTVIGFAEGVDHLSFAGETAAAKAQIVASAKIANGNTVLTFPDHSTITLAGLAHIDAGIFG